MSKQNSKFLDAMRQAFKYINSRPAVGFSRIPKAWQHQTDYNPVVPGSDIPEQLDMRPKAVEAREKEARNSLIWPIVAIVSVVVVLALAILIKKLS